MEKAVVVAKEDFAAIRTGRAHPAMFNKIVADYYGALTPINQLASFSVPEPRMAVVSPFDKSRSCAHRAGDPRLRPRRQPEQRRQDHPGGASRSSPRSAARSTSRSPRTRREDAKISIRTIRRKAKDDARQARQGRRGRRGRRPPRREGARRHHARSTSTQSTSCSSTRKPSCSRSDERPRHHRLRAARQGRASPPTTGGTSSPVPRAPAVGRRADDAAGTAQRRARRRLAGQGRPQPARWRSGVGRGCSAALVLGAAVHRQAGVRRRDRRRGRRRPVGAACGRSAPPRRARRWCRCWSAAPARWSLAGTDRAPRRCRSALALTALAVLVWRMTDGPRATCGTSRRASSRRSTCRSSPAFVALMLLPTTGAGG